MIGRLRGTVVDEQPDGTLTLDIQGVGYEVLSPLGTRGRAQSTGEDLTLWVHTVMRENSLELFGFSSELERRVFRVLIGVHGVGPRTAVAILSAAPLDDLLAAVESSEVARLVRIPGIGKKTAERLVLELKGKLPASTTPGRHATPGQGPLLVSALVNLGFKGPDAERVVKGMEDLLGSQPMPALVREALARLGKPGPPGVGGA